jgi:glutamate-1-semialdehyde 2,1-aminomutase
MVTTGIPGGIPADVANETLTFRYNDFAGVEQLFADHRDEVACVVLEPARTEEPQGNFLHRLRDLAHRSGALFVLDETITGFRWAIGGGQEVFDVTPDLAVFGKALGNGFSISALTGRREIMDLGGLRHSSERVFLLSTTHGAETHSLAAAAKVIEIYRSEDVIGSLYRKGERLACGVRQAAISLGLERQFTLFGRPCALLYGTSDAQGKPSQQLRTLFLQELVKRGILAPSFIVSYSHSDADIDWTIEAVAEALQIYRQALDDGVERFLLGPCVKPVYRRFN